MKRTIKLTESELHSIIEQCINEIGDTPRGQYALGQAAGRRFKRWDKSRNSNRPADMDSLHTSDELEKHAIANKSKQEHGNKYTTDDFNAGFQDKFYESKLENIVRESLRKTINEGHWNSEFYDKWEQVRELVGDDTMLQELYNYLSGDEIEDFIYDHMGRNYELGIE